MDLNMNDITYAWALAFYEKRHEVIFIQLDLRRDISYLNREYMSEIHVPIYANIFWYAMYFR